MRCYGHCAIFALLLQLLKGELILIRNKDDVYCMEDNSNRYEITALIPTIERNKKITYEEEVVRVPAYEDLDEFYNLNCDLMQDGGCPLADEFNETWEIIDHASDDYGIVSDHHWHALPVYNTSGDPFEMQQIPVTISEKRLIYMSILAKDNAIISVSDGVKGFLNIILDTIVGGLICTLFSHCPQNNISVSCYGKEHGCTNMRCLNNGKSWKNVKFSIAEDSYLRIKINDQQIYSGSRIYNKVDYGIGQVMNLYISTSNQQMGFWKFHDYQVLRLKDRGNTALTLDFETGNNPKLCLSILHHSASVHVIYPTAATLTIASSTETIEDILVAGENWKEYRRVFNLKINTQYQLRLLPMENYPKFAIGEIRVCHEKEYSVTKMKKNREENNTMCSHVYYNYYSMVDRNLEADRFSFKCSNGNFGSNCGIKCSEFGSDNCKDFKVCTTSYCSCVPGYNGTRCEKECPGYFGPNCKLPCNCRNKTQCDFVKGSCPNAECEDGYILGYNDQSCQKKCEDGKYGHKCSQKCSAYCPIANRCSHTDGTCTQNKCKPEIYEPPTCQYPRMMLSESSQLTKSGVNNFKLNIPSRGIATEIKSSIHQIGVQNRLHNQSAAEWHEGARLPFSAVSGTITLPGLTPKTTYDVRVILYDATGNGNVGDKVPVLSAVTTLCKPAGKAELQVEPVKNIIQIKINSKSTAQWNEGVRLPFSGASGNMTLPGLAPKTTYDVRAILYNARSNGIVGDKVPVLSAVTTLCRPAGKAELQVVPVKNIIEIKINSPRNKEDCVSSDYIVTIRGTDQQIILNKDLMGRSGGLEYSSEYVVDVTASDQVVSITVVTELDERVVLCESPQVIKSGVNYLKLSITSQGMSEKLKSIVHEFGIQNRLHNQSTAQWNEGLRLPISAASNPITLSGLTPKISYDVRVIFYNARGNAIVADKVPVLSAVTTLCKPAGNAELQVVPVKNIIEIKINSPRNKEDCVSSDYIVTIRGTDQQIILNKDLMGRSGGLEYSSEYVVDVTASDQVVSITVVTELDERVVLCESPQVIKSGVNYLKLSITSQGISEKLNSFHEIGIQNRLHNQSTAQWNEGLRLPISAASNPITLSGLTPKTTYDVRVIFYNARGNAIDADKVPVLSAATTLCRPAGKAALQVEPVKNIIQIKINSLRNKEDCASSDYVVTVRGTDQRIILNEDLMGRSGGLEYNSEFVVDVAASDTVLLFTVVTESETSTLKPIVGGLLVLIFILLVSFLTLLMYYCRKMKRNRVTPATLVEEAVADVEAPAKAEVETPNKTAVEAPVIEAVEKPAKAVVEKPAEEEEVVYDEIDICKAVPRPEIPPQLPEVPGCLGAAEPNLYVKVRDQQPMLPLKKRFEHSENEPSNVEQVGYEVPVFRRNVAETST